MGKRSLIIAVLTLAILAVAGYFLASAALMWIRGLDSDVAAAVITAILGLFGLWYAQWHSRSREISESHRQSKIEVYNIFFDIVDKFQDDSVDTSFTSKEDAPEWLKNDFKRLNRGLILWGSPDVIRAWLNFRAVAGSGHGNILVSVDTMYQAIRKDLGNSNFGLQSGDLIKSTVSDPENWGK
jgi:hypothetical protein